ncbi:TlpA family protein disulfide reductase [Acidithiobacillus sp. CV18-2]|uniref:TlpA family protein disulfide reductase n=1 Tax=Acidithiobacillus caldus TaxID=33059 RepID=UPI0019D1ED1C|nr:TlpA disulfide reductase family protein [Acidithiobacillus caldus]MBN6741174.1 TlpA family protein disulfide reductase [Acidithiobacillus sp. MC6.1]MBU2753429.1 TlpA family protein disulfide reductase [Acidithiobacillus sp. CV18-3]MBU2756094.1 TlpA family protein disulfide reductase [Acidithiobacillus sp. BN09-2]MBU2776401.1 TlpA family protein disulfide reductase [Acidithiobacillus sp. CV18-2]MBU2800164.1 TlpA family protein disulfide reductase [Acidithiobacillus sp. VAN18-4]
MNRIIFRLITILSCAFFMAVGTLQGAMAGPSVSPSYLPDLILPNMADHSVSLTNLEGKLLVVNVWANWCPVCHQETPGLVRLHKKLGAKVRFVGIAIDNKASASHFIAQEKIDYPVLLAEPHPGRVLTALGDKSGMLPYTLLVLPNGRILLTHLGYYPEKILLNNIQQIKSNNVSR